SRRFYQPARHVRVRPPVLAVKGPRDRLPDRPAASALAVQGQLRDEPVETAEHLLPRVAELAGADNRRDPELPLADERLRVDPQPGLALRGQDVVAVQVLVQQHLRALGPRQLLERLESGVEQLALERAAEPLPRVLERVGPPRS